MHNWTKTLLLIRGHAGSGKSTLALSLVNGNEKQVVENDQYWWLPDKVEQGYSYQYDVRMTQLAASWCMAEAFRKLRIHDVIAVANTFVKREYLFSYIEEARKLQVNVKVLEPTTIWAKDPVECSKRNTHRVPIEIIFKMQSQWEEMTQAEVDVLLGKK